MFFALLSFFCQEFNQVVLLVVTPVKADVKVGFRLPTIQTKFLEKFRTENASNLRKQRDGDLSVQNDTKK